LEGQNFNMKQINYDTDRLIVLNYPIGAGGKFIGLCLALSPKVLHQDEQLARQKMRGDLRGDGSFLVGKSVIERSQDNHFELGCRELAGFNSGNDRKDPTLANDLWGELTNQQEFYFCMVDHQGDQWDHYPNAQHIILKGYDWLLDERGLPRQERAWYRNKKEEYTTTFDQSSVKDPTSFKEELGRLYGFLALEEPTWDHIEQLRSLWLDTFRTGF
jgi:hypothetical protein